MSEPDYLKLDAKFQIQADPALLAKAFWSLDSDEMALFFEALHAEVTESYKTNKHCYSLGEMQWLLMRDSIRELSDEASEMYMALSAWAYDFWPRNESL